MSKREVDGLKRLCQQLPRNPVIIQIGAERGVSTLAMLEERPDAFIFSIDMDPRPEEFENLRKAELNAGRVVRGLGRSQGMGVYWPSDWKCHLLYVDGDHREMGAVGDIANWVPKVADGGIAAFHDYIHPDDRGPSIQGRVWEALQGSEMMDKEVVLHVHRLIAFRCWDELE
jgi:predicted O-methyltransferase YrrM